MPEDDFIEIDVSEFYRSVQLAVKNGHVHPYKDCYLYDPNSDLELKIRDCKNNRITFEGSNGASRETPITALVNWTALIPKSHLLTHQENISPDGHQAKRELVENLKVAGLPLNYELRVEELKLIKKCYESELDETNANQRKVFYTTVKKLENFPQYQRDSFRIGRLVVEKWGVRTLSDLPADVLIHLAYYRRWSKDTDAALRVTECLKGKDFNAQITAKERAILATERAAAFLDLHEKQGGGLQEALRFLKYSFAANGGANTVENANCWKRYEKLAN